MRQHHPLIAVALISGMLACAADDGTDRPKNLIPADKMADMLTEVHLAEARVGRYALQSSDSSNMVFNRLNERILNKFNVDTSAYRRSYIYYSSHPDQFEAIYKDVTEQLQKMTSTQSTSATSGSSSSGPSTRPGITLPSSISQ